MTPNQALEILASSTDNLPGATRRDHARILDALETLKQALPPEARERDVAIAPMQRHYSASNKPTEILAPSGFGPSR